MPVAPEDQRAGRKVCPGCYAALDVSMPERASGCVRLGIVLDQDLGVDAPAKFFGWHVQEYVKDAFTGLIDRPVIVHGADVMDRIFPVEANRDV